MTFGDYIPIICGAGILLWVIIRLLLKRMRCTLNVHAICVEHKKRPGKATYSPVYEILWNGEKIRINSKTYINNIGKIRPAVGEEVELKINPNNPLDFIGPHDLKGEIAPILVALIFIFMPIYFKFFYVP